MEEKNQNIEYIEKKINELKKTVMEGFDKRAEELRYAQEKGLEQFTADLIVVRNNMLIDLDNRLALINIEFRNSAWLPGIILEKGKWKVLVLAKRVP